MLDVDDLKVHYRTLAGPVRALDGISFSMNDGEILGVAGESGCGKSTLGKSLIRLEAQMLYVEGKVTLDGKELPVWDDQGMNAFRFNEVSLIPQYAMSALNPTRKIGRMAGELLESRGHDFGEIRPEMERRLRMIGLDPKVLDNYPIELSGGMKQRVVIVLSTLLNPSLLIADEVTSSLDVSTQKAVARALVEFQAFVKSTILITHDLAILAQIATQIMVMYAGRPAEKAPTETIVSRPAHPYTRMLLGSLPEVGVRFADKRLSGIAGRPPSLLDPPKGCRFRDRCPLAFDKCAEDPPYKKVGPDHWAACWKADVQ